MSDYIYIISDFIRCIPSYPTRPYPTISKMEYPIDTLQGPGGGRLTTINYNLAQEKRVTMSRYDSSRICPLCIIINRL